MSVFITKDLCDEKHRASEKGIEDIKDSLKWVNRQLILGLLGIIGILLVTIWNSHSHEPLIINKKVEASTLIP